MMGVVYLDTRCSHLSCKLSPSLSYSTKILDLNSSIMKLY